MSVCECKLDGAAVRKFSIKSIRKIGWVYCTGLMGSVGLHWRARWSRPVHLSHLHSGLSDLSISTALVYAETQMTHLRFKLASDLYLEVPGFNVSRDTNYPDSGFTCYSQCLQANSKRVHEVVTLPFSWTSFPIHHSLIIPPFSAVWSELMTAALSKQQKNEFRLD
jgi:hypothetical protein